MSRTDFGTHAYWRAMLRLPVGFKAASAMLFKDETGTPVAASGGTALESAHFGGFVPGNLFDANDTTFWESTNIVDVWIGYQFATPVKIMQIAIQRSAATMDGSPPPSLMLFQFSDDGLAWGEVGFFTVGTLTDNVPKWCDFAGAL